MRKLSNNRFLSCLYLYLSTPLPLPSCPLLWAESLALAARHSLSQSVLSLCQHGALSLRFDACFYWVFAVPARSCPERKVWLGLQEIALIQSIFYMLVKCDAEGRKKAAPRQLHCAQFIYIQQIEERVCVHLCGCKWETGELSASQQVPRSNSARFSSQSDIVVKPPPKRNYLFYLVL